MSRDCLATVSRLSRDCLATIPQPQALNSRDPSTGLLQGARTAVSAAGTFSRQKFISFCRGNVPAAETAVLALCRRPVEGSILWDCLATVSRLSRHCLATVSRLSRDWSDSPRGSIRPAKGKHYAVRNLHAFVTMLLVTSTSPVGFPKQWFRPKLRNNPASALI